ncbi:hypothetical protein ACVW0P_001846 [Mucilaginibacter sp. UYNi724]
MNTKPIMMASAIFLAFIGVAFTFMPQEIATYTGMGFSKLYQLQLQILGALFFGFAMLNWMAKGAIIGGIYNKPIAVANFAHFFIGGPALVKAIISNIHLHYIVWIVTIFYAIFAILFGTIFSKHPSNT